MSNRGRVFLGLCVTSVVALTGYIYYTRRPAPEPVSASVTAPATLREAKSATAISPGEAVQAPPEDVTEATSATTQASFVAPLPASASTPGTPVAPARAAPPWRQVFFRYNGLDDHYGQLAFVRPEHATKPHFVKQLTCEVVHASATRGLCLTADRGVFTTYAAHLFNVNTYEILATFPLQGVPSRCRVSADGTRAALTVFVSGHGYTALDFSTQTLLIDVPGAKILADLETFDVERDGQPFKNADFNFWGVTFTPDAKRFYATLSSAGKHFLVRGDIAARSARVLHENVECPSLSPDATRVAYKKRSIVNNRIEWQLHVLDLNSDSETPLAEKRSIDDQLEWLDNSTVLYSVPAKSDDSSPSTDVWRAAADGRSTPEVFLKNAFSPAVVH